MCQRGLWAYAVYQDHVEAPDASSEYMSRINLFVNLAIVNALIELVLSFVAPVTAFVLLFFKIPLMLMALIYLASLRRRMAVKLQPESD